MGNILRYGVITSSLLSALGLVYLIAVPPSNEPQTVMQLATSGYGATMMGFGGIATGLGSGDPTSLLELGMLVLVATPLARVIASVVIFASERDRAYASITVIVLVMLLVAVFLIGPAEG